LNADLKPASRRRRQRQHEFVARLRAGPPQLRAATPAELIDVLNRGLAAGDGDHAEVFALDQLCNHGARQAERGKQDHTLENTARHTSGS